MARVLDLNTVERPMLELHMADENRTVLYLTTPTEALVQELQELGKKLPDVQSGNVDSIAFAYDLTARLMSCNRDGVKVTADDLRHKFCFKLETLFIFYGAYFDFINEIKNQKN